MTVKELYEKAKAKGKDLLSKGKNLFKKKNKKDKE